MMFFPYQYDHSCPIRDTYTGFGLALIVGGLGFLFLSNQSAAGVEFSHTRGYITAPTTVELTATNQILYSTEWGYEWSNDFAAVAQVYTGPIQITGSTQLRAMEVGSDRVVSHTYIDLSSYSPDEQERIQGYPAFVTTGDEFGYRVIGYPEFSLDARTIVEFWQPGDDDDGAAAPAGIRLLRYGEDQEGQFRIYFRQEYGAGRLDYQLFPNETSGAQLPNGGYDKVNFHGGSQDRLGYSWNFNNCFQGEGTLMRDRFFQRLQRRMSGEGVPGAYYIMWHQGRLIGVKNAEDAPQQAFMAEHFGGAKEDYGLWTYYSREIDPGYFVETVDDFQARFDVRNFFDYLTIMWFSGNSDWASINNNNNVHVGGLENGPYYHWVWDSHATDPGCSENWGAIPEGIVNPLDNPDVQMAFADRSLVHFGPGGDMETVALLELWDSIAAELAPAIPLVHDEDDWRIAEQNLRNRISSTSGSLLSWMRTEGYASTIPAVQYSHPSGPLPAGATVSLTGGADIYFTTDGTDPRAPGGALSLSAQRYTGAIPLPDGTVQMLARLRSGSDWGPARPMVFQVGTGLGLVINEIHYHPRSEVDAGLLVNDKQYEFIEIANLGATALNLEYFRIQGGIRFKFDINRSPILQPGEKVVLAGNVERFMERYGVAPDGQFIGSLSNGSEELRLVDSELRTIHSVTYRDTEWGTDGLGYSLAFDPVEARFRKSFGLDGSPGEPNLFCDPLTAVVLLNEINYDSSLTADSGDWVELHNPMDTAVNLSGWRLVDGGDNTYVIPDGVVLPADGIIVLVENPAEFSSQFPGIPYLGPMGYSLSNGGEHLVLTDSDGCPVNQVRYDDDPPWDTAADGTGQSLAFVGGALANQEPWQWVARTPTPGAANAQPDCPPVPTVVISELNVDSTPFVDAGDWIELHNTGDAFADVSNWRIFDEHRRLDLPQNTFIPPSGSIVVAEDVFAFLTVFPGMAVINGAGFTLRGSGERVVVTTAEGCLVDDVAYQTSTPWPSDGLGFGATLQLVDVTLDNSVGSAWVTSTGLGTPGAPNDSEPCQTPQIALDIPHLEVAGTDGDWISIRNTEAVAINLTGYHLSNGGTTMWIPSNTVLAANGELVFAQDIPAYQQATPGSSAMLMPLNFGFPDDLGTVTLYGPRHCPVALIHYNLQRIDIDVAVYAGTGSLQFSSLPGTQYQVEACENLTTGLWQTVATLTANATTLRFTPETAGNRRFYRISLID